MNHLGKKATKLTVMLVLAIALIASLAGCGKKSDAPDTSAAPGTNAAEGTKNDANGKTASKQTTYPLTLKDASGKEITIQKAPERIASLAPSETEILFALGLGDKVVGVTEFCDYPEEAKSKPKVGNLQGNAEVLIAAKPDIIVSGLSLNGKTVDELRALSLNVFTVEPKTVDETIEAILTIGKITNTQEQAEKVVATMKQEKQKVVDAVKDIKPEEKKKVFLEFFDPLWTAGKGTFMDELITLSGGTNIAASVDGWAQINEEIVIQQNPDVILYAQGSTDANGTPLEQKIKERKGWDQLNGLKNNRLLGIDQNLISRPGPRLTKGLTDMAKAIYPDKVK